MFQHFTSIKIGCELLIKNEKQICLQLAWNLGLLRSLLALWPKKKKKNCQRLLRVVVALNQGHT